jgi:Endonuclease NucS
MLEREMEELIARFPHEFFPKENLTLVGRQRTFQGVGRFDLMFKDPFGTQVLMELKAKTLKYEDATQVAKYRDALKAQGERRLLMWLVAPRVPQSVSDFLDEVGIQWTEIRAAKFQDVAHRHNLEFAASETEGMDKVGMGAEGRIHSPARTPNKSTRGLDEGVAILPIPQALERAAQRLLASCGNRIPREKLIDETASIGNYNPTSIIPSDFCYNRENRGSRKLRLFIWHPGGKYEYVGSNFEYNGPIIRDPRKRRK